MTPDPLVLTLRAHLAESLGAGPIGLAVSGGGDSMALMHLAAAAGIRAEVATVDHRLRPEAAAEAAAVARQAAGLGFAHATLVWQAGGSAKGNLADAARRARYGLLAAWARERAVSAVILAHTQDDLAETFLMRLARGAGLDGLSAMSDVFLRDGVTFRRPLLSVSRKQLRDWLAARSIPWFEDPTNADPAYDRTRARSALGALSPLGITAERLGDVARHLAAARTALEAATQDLLSRVARVQGEGLALRLDLEDLIAAPDDLARRAVLAMIDWIQPADYPPRGAQVTALLARLSAGQGGELAGARFLRWKGEVWAVAGRAWPEGAWVIEPAPPPDWHLAPLEPHGLAQCPDWRRMDLPRAALSSAPGLWYGKVLMAAPHAGRAAGFRMWRAGAQTVSVPRRFSH